MMGIPTYLFVFVIIYEVKFEINKLLLEQLRLNRPFPSSCLPSIERESKCEN